MQLAEAACRHFDRASIDDDPDEAGGFVDAASQATDADYKWVTLYTAANDYMDGITAFNDRGGIRLSTALLDRREAARRACARVP